MKVKLIFQCYFIFIFLFVNVSAGGEYVPWIDVFKEVVNNGLIFSPRLPPCNNQNCINGKCMPLNECECFDGFEGIKCDRRIASSTTITTPIRSTIVDISDISFDDTVVIHLNEITVKPKVNTTILPEVTVTSNNSVNDVSSFTTDSTTISSTGIPTSTNTEASEITGNFNLFTESLPFNLSTTVIPTTVKSNFDQTQNISTTVIPKAVTLPTSQSTVTTSTSTFTTTVSIPTVILTTVESNFDQKPNYTTSILTTVTPTTPFTSTETHNKSSTSISTTTVPLPTVIPKCPFFNYCNKVAKNGICDLRCNIKECNFDNGDCIDKKTTAADSDKDNIKCPEICLQQLGNGICNEECNTKICNFDKNDCLKTSTPVFVEAEKVKLKIIYETNPNNFDKNKASKLLNKFSQLSNIPNIHFSTTDSGDAEIYKWTKDAGKGDLIKLKSASSSKYANLEGVEIYFNVDFGECKKSEAKCKFQNAKEVENYINTAPVYEAIKVTAELGAPVYEAQVIYPEEKKSDGIGTILSIAFVGFGIVMISAVGVLEKRTRKRNVTVAFPQSKDYPEDFAKRRRYESETFESLYKLMRLRQTSESDLLEIVQTIYNIRGSLDFKTERNETLLHWAIRLNHFHMATWLMDKVDDINAADNSGNTYLFDSIKNNDTSFNIFQRLLQIPELEVNTLQGPNITPLKKCAESDALLRFFKLLSAHPKINIRAIGFLRDRKCKRQNVLHHAAGYGSVDIIKYLLQLKTKKRQSETNLIATLDDNGRTPLVYALESEQWEAAKLLMENMKPLEFTIGIPALLAAKQCENDEMYQLIKAKIPKEKTPPPPPPKKKEAAKTSPYDFIKSQTDSFPVLPSTSTMIPNMGYSNQQYYSPQQPQTMNQHPSPLITPQHQLVPCQIQYPQQQLLASTNSVSPMQQVQYPQVQVPFVTHQSPPMVAQTTQKQTPQLQYPQAQVYQQSMVQYTQPAATVPQYVQNEQYYADLQSQTPPSRSESQLRRMLSQPTVQEVCQQQQQQHYHCPSNYYGSMQQSIPSSSTTSTTTKYLHPPTEMPQQNQQLQQQCQNQQLQYPQDFAATSYVQQPAIYYSNYPQYQSNVPVQRQHSQKRAQSYSVISTPQYYSELHPSQQQLQQQSTQYYSTANLTNYANYQQSVHLPPSQQQHPNEQYYEQQQQQISTSTYYSQNPQISASESHPQNTMLSNYENNIPSTTIISPNLSPLTNSDTSGYETAGSFLNITNDSFHY